MVLTPVSYTHLDVYKRQGLELGKSLMNIAAGKVVYLCAEVTSGSLEEAMKDYGELIKIPVYRNEYVDTYAEYEMKDFIDVSGIAVTSGISGERIKWLIDKLGESGEVPVYSIGPACSKKLVEAGVKENRIKMCIRDRKQRLSIARVFLKNPPILIFDEATSALDNESEQIVQESLEKLAKNRTTFVIAHRLTTIENAEEILMLTDEGIKERGTHEELMKLDGEYARMVKIHSRT